MIEMVYVQPHRQNNDTGLVIDFAQIAQWLSDRFGQSEFEAALAKALSSWSKD